jgi:hypothetical protein
MNLKNLIGRQYKDVNTGQRFFYYKLYKNMVWLCPVGDGSIEAMPRHRFETNLKKGDYIEVHEH